jgi:ABC-2 type transport system permease protein
MSPLARTLAITAHETRATIVSVIRMPQFWAPNVLLPVSFYALFGLAFDQGDPRAAQYTLATYAVFAAAGPALFGFGAGIASEREAGLIALKRVSPMPVGAIIAARLAASMAVTAASLVLVFGAAAVCGVSMPAWRWLAVFAIGLASVVPFGLIGLNVGTRLGAQGATAVANALFLGFCMLGGLWIPLSQMPGWMTKLAWALPSFHLGRLSLGLSGVVPMQDAAAHAATVTVMAALAGLGAWMGWRRESA